MKDLPPIFIKSINPGYTVDGQSNVGEFIELARLSSNELFLLTNLILKYTNSSGNAVVLYAFPEGSFMDGENLLLRFANSPTSELANVTYSKTLAMSSGPLELILNGEVIDSICWNGKNECTTPFRSSNPTTLVRGDDNIFLHQAIYEPIYHSDSFRLLSEESTLAGAAPPKCQGLQFSEIFSYYDSSPSEQFIEFYNSTNTTISLEGCFLRYKNKNYPLSGSIPSNDYSAYVSSEILLTKNPTTSNTIELFDVDGALVDILNYPSQKKSTSYAKIDGIWQPTYAITKGSANIFQQYKTCEAGKTINEATGNCVKIPKSTAKTCTEGYFLNPDTNRCKKIPSTTNTGAEYTLEIPPPNMTDESFVALNAVLIILAIGCIYIIFQFREDLKRLFDKVFRRSRQKPRRVFDRH